MGRQVRRVPASWEHPKDDNGRYIPLYETSYKEARDEWYSGAALWVCGNHPSQKNHPDTDYHEYAGSPPERDQHMPGWPESERTHWQMYEDTSEGTPISPVMESPEALAHWLADNHASSFGNSTATYEQWLATIKRGWAPSAAIIPGKGIISGVELADE